jgi:hypothetical protein
VTATPMAGRRNTLVVLLLALWIPAIGAGVWYLIRFSNTPSPLANPPQRWPLAVSELAPDRATLILFGHPHCSCTRATLSELARIVACCGGNVSVRVFFCAPRQDAKKFVSTDLWKSAMSIPGVRVTEDPLAATARRFGVQTSGQALVYDQSGRLVFNGGITPLRGHEGDSDGKDAIVSILRGETPRYRTTPVFGCALWGSSQ